MIHRPVASARKAKVLGPEELVLLLLRTGQELTMSHPKYLSALRTEARDLGLARLSVRAADDRELGKLLGFVPYYLRIPSMEQHRSD